MNRPRIRRLFYAASKTRYVNVYSYVISSHFNALNIFFFQSKIMFVSLIALRPLRRPSQQLCSYWDGTSVLWDVHPTLECHHPKPAFQSGGYQTMKWEIFQLPIAYHGADLYNIWSFVV